MPYAAHVMFPRCRVYVHCTAGLGRAPAVCIAYLYWWCGMDLDDAYKYPHRHPTLRAEGEDRFLFR